MTSSTQDSDGLKRLVADTQARDVFRSFIGLTPDEIVFLIVPVVGVAWLGGRLGLFSPGNHIVELLFLVGILGLAIRMTPPTLTPYTYTAKWGRFLVRRLQMPYTASAARGIPGIHDIEEIPGPGDQPIGIAETSSDRGIAVVLVDPSGANDGALTGTYLDQGEWTVRTAGLSDEFESIISKNNIDVQLCYSTRHPHEAGGRGDAVSSSDGLGRVLVDETATEDARMYAEESLAHMAESVADRGIMDRRLALVVSADVDERGGFIPFVGASEGARTRRDSTLRDRISSAAEVADALGGARVLDGDDLATHLRDYWLSDASEHIDMSDQTVAGGVRELLWGPDWINETATHVEVGDRYASSLWVASWPTHPDAGLLSMLSATPDVEFDGTLHVGSPDRRAKVGKLDDWLETLSLAGWRRGEQGDEGATDDADRAHGEVRELRNYSQREEAEIGEVSATITLWGDSPEELERARETVIKRCRRVGVEAKPEHGEHLTALHTTAPGQDDRLNRRLRSAVGEALSSILNVHVQLGTETRVDVPIDTLACLIPPNPTVRCDPKGTHYGLAQYRHPTTDLLTSIGSLQIDRRNLQAPHRQIIGDSGSGKTYRETGQLYDELASGVLDQAVIIDIAENFEGLVETFNGSIVTPGETTLNPFAISPDGASRQDTIDLATDVLMYYAMDNAPKERAIELRPTIKRTVTEMFDRAGFTDDPETHDKPSPVFADWADTLEEIDAGGRDVSLRDTETEREEWSEDVGYLLTRFASFPKEYGFLCPNPDAGDDPEGDASITDTVVVFDLSAYQDRDDAAKTMLSTYILAHAFRAAGKTAREKLIGVVCDEAHDIFSDSMRAGRFETTVRAGRNRGLAFDFLTQAAADFSVDEAEIIQGQCEVTIAADLGTDADPAEVQQLGFNAKAASAICGGLEGGEGGADYSEAMVLVDGESYRTQYSTPPVVDAMIDYRKREDGDWREHIDDALVNDPVDYPDADGHQVGVAADGGKTE